MHIAIFQPKAELSAQKNMEEFIRHCRDDLALYVWSDLTWKHTRTGRNIATFTRYGGDNSNYPSPEDAMHDPFLSQVKAYVRYKQTNKESTSIGAFPMMAIKAIHDGLLAIHTGKSPDILDLDGPTQQKVSEILIGRYPNPQVRNKVGNGLVSLYEFVQEKAFVPSLPVWKNPHPRQKAKAIKTDQESLDWQANRLPTLHQITSLAECFAQSKTDEDQFWSSVIVMLMFAPSRAGELASLTTDCLIERDGNLYVRWYGKKGFGGYQKFVPKVMEPSVREAVARLTRIGAEARAVAKSAYIGNDSMEAIPSADDSERAIWESLVIHLDRQFHKTFSENPSSWRTLDVNRLNAQLHSKTDNGQKRSSIFERMGKRNEDGSEIYLTSHQIRVWLSTIAERAGMDDWTIAHWAARSDVRHNEHYDLRSREEIREPSKTIMVPEYSAEHALDLANLKERPSAIQLVRMNQPVAYIDLGKQMMGAAQSTLYGFCTTDWAQSPCLKAHQCLTCKEHKCVKGDETKLKNLKKHLIFLRAQLALAKEAVVEECHGAEIWFERHQNDFTEASKKIQELTMKLATVETIVQIMDDNSVPDGAVISIPPEHDPDPVERALSAHGIDTAPRRGDLVATDSIINLLGIPHV